MKLFQLLLLVAIICLSQARTLHQSEHDLFLYPTSTLYPTTTTLFHEKQNHDLFLYPTSTLYPTTTTLFHQKNHDLFLYPTTTSTLYPTTTYPLY